ncbi:MAG: alpha/beta hydrolase [Prosthecobacter sp.]|jgi:acetyl esterase/lipase|uniref:alpha/beta hydrolase n=1 Tax=Prosthecobacter sp. TaxID=1965333 RepID=UPI0019EE1499|nr:alpha/beta hydrolase [Prosthecobacter sp.]MBE2286464.1 alpha/beta hydrolase [Prosthecobacter sp.]
MKRLLALLFATSAFAADTIRTEHDVDYLGGGRKEKADLYLPANPQPGQRFPAVVIIHGGGWSGGEKRAAREINIGTTLALNGYVGMSIDYVLANSEHPGPTWPQNLHDCKTAVRWLRANAERLHIDPAHIGVIGGSAGGHLAAMVGLCGGELDPPGEGDTRVQCAVDLYGPVLWFEQRDLAMFRKAHVEAPELYKQADPRSHIDKNDPPLLILHGTADKTVAVADSEALAVAMKAAGAAYKLEIIPDAPHTFHLQPKQRDLRPLVLGFFDKHLKPKAR